MNVSFSYNYSAASDSVKTVKTAVKTRSTILTGAWCRSYIASTILNIDFSLTRCETIVGGQIRVSLNAVVRASRSPGRVKPFKDLASKTN